MENSTKTTIAKNLRHYLESKGLTQLDLAKAIDASPASVTVWLQGKSAPRADTVDKICKFLNIHKTDLVLDGEPSTLPPAISIPLYNSIYAEKNFFADSNVERYLTIDPTMSADFGILVSSPSMSGAGIDVGDIAFFTKDYQFTEGKIYAVWILDRDSVALKRVYIRDNKYVLVSEHSEFFPLVIENNEAFIIGELNGLYKKWNNEKV